MRHMEILDPSYNCSLFVGKQLKLFVMWETDLDHKIRAPFFEQFLRQNHQYQLHI